MAKSTTFKYLAHKKVVDNYVHYKLTYESDSVDKPDEIVASDEIALIIRIALRGMPKQRRRVFEMNRFEGMSNEEIAKELNITTDTVRSHLSHVIRELKEILS